MSTDTRLTGKHMPDDQERTDPRAADAQRANLKGDGAQSTAGCACSHPDKGLITRSPGAPRATGPGVPPGAADRSSKAPPRAKRTKKVVPVEQELLMGR